VSLPIDSTSLPTIIHATNGILIGDQTHNYTWINFYLLTDLSTPVTLTLPGGIDYNIGRIIVNGTTIIGTVDLSTGNMQFLDESGKVQMVSCYEVLVCDEEGKKLKLENTINN
jgi:hypothetical protein